MEDALVMLTIKATASSDESGTLYRMIQHVWTDCSLCVKERIDFLIVRRKIREDPTVGYCLLAGACLSVSARHLAQEGIFTSCTECKIDHPVRV